MFAAGREKEKKRNPQRKINQKKKKKLDRPVKTCDPSSKVWKGLESRVGCYGCMSCAWCETGPKG